MSRFPGYRLEDFVEDAYFCADERDVLLITKVLEPARNTIEMALANYDEEDHGSWRDYRNSEFPYRITPEMEAQIEELHT